MDIEKMSYLDLEMMLNRPFYRCEEEEVLRKKYGSVQSVMGYVYENKTENFDSHFLGIYER